MSGEYKEQGGKKVESEGKETICHLNFFVRLKLFTSPGKTRALYLLHFAVFVVDHDTESGIFNYIWNSNLGIDLR